MTRIVLKHDLQEQITKAEEQLNAEMATFDQAPYFTEVYRRKYEAAKAYLADSSKAPAAILDGEAKAVGLSVGELASVVVENYTAAQKQLDDNEIMRRKLIHKLRQSKNMDDITKVFAEMARFKPGTTEAAQWLREHLAANPRVEIYDDGRIQDPTRIRRGDAVEVKLEPEA
jgi:predicted Mrr-cat superfamily restriction endonuclease